MTAEGTDPTDPALRAPRPGVHRVLGEPGALLSRLAGQGWTVGRVGAMPDRRALLTAIGEALHFPGYYGRNLDALDECLGDLQRPTVLVWSGWQRSARADPDGWSALLDIFAQRADQHPEFLVLLV